MTGKWLGYTQKYEEYKENELFPAPYFRKEFGVAKKVVKAELNFAALGWIKVFINGNEVTKDDELLVSWTDYGKKIEYLTYDVTAFLGEKNAVGCVLGNGWACGQVFWGEFKKHYAVNTPCFVAEIVLSYEDGTVEKVATDESWKASIGEIVTDDIFAGEFVDRRLAQDGFSEVGFDDSLWKKPTVREDKNALLCKATCPKTRVCERIPLKKLSENGGVSIWTTEQNLAGIVECEITGKYGATAQIRHGEMLNADGTLYTENLRTAKQTDVFVCAGESKAVFRPKFTFHGFQYVEIKVEEGVTVSNPVALVLHTDLKKTGEFSCSSELVNKIYSNALWGQKSNFVNVPTDCPQRDERLGWTADTQTFASSASFNMDCAEFYKKFLFDLKDSQKEDGSIPAVALLPPAVMTEGDNSSAWGDCAILLPYYHYAYYRDVDFIKSYLPVSKKYLQKVENILKDDLRQCYHYGDWLSTENTLPQLFDTLFVAYDNLILSRLCEVVGDEDGEKYLSRYEELKAHIRKTYYDEKFVAKTDTQTAYLLGYAFGVLTADEMRDNLVKAVERADYHLSSGFIGIKYLLPVLCKLGRSDLAYKIVSQKTYPSWGYSIEQGATTIWERWNSYTKENGFGDVGMNSFNHYSLGSCTEWFYSGVLGFDMENSTAEKVVLRPYIDKTGVLTWAKGEYDGLFGKVKISWETDGKTAKYSVETQKKVEIDVKFDGFEVATATQTENGVSVSLTAK